jgi:hypothetical protein
LADGKTSELPVENGIGLVSRQHFLLDEAPGEGFSIGRAIGGRDSPHEILEGRWREQLAFDRALDKLLARCVASRPT